MFEEQRKDWEEIAKISHPRTLRAFTLLDLSIEFGRMMIPMFPEYFSGKEPEPVPLSIIRRLGAYRQECPGDDPSIYDHYWIKMGLDDNLVIRFAANEVAGIRGDFPLLPDKIREQVNRETAIGDIFAWKDRELVLLWDDRGKDICGLMNFAPAEWFDPAG